MSRPPTYDHQFPVEHKVKCRLRIHVDDKPATPVQEHDRIYLLEWSRKDAHIQVEFSKHQHSIYKQAEDTKRRIERHSGTCRIFAERTQFQAASPQLVDEIDKLSIVIQRMIVIFWHNNPHDPLRLEIDLHYCTYPKIDHLSSEEAKISLRDQMQKKMKTNYEDERYLPRRHLLSILSTESITRVLEDSDLEQSIIKEVVKWASVRAWCHIFGIWLLSEKPLASLVQLYENGFGKLLPMDREPLMKAGFGDNFADNVQTYRRKLQAHEFTYNLDHRELVKDMIMPYELEPPKSAAIGRGSFGVVYRIRIDRDQHSLSHDPDVVFALKKISGLDETRRRQSFIQECEILEFLSIFKHPHIVPVYAIWEQRQEGCILMQCAERNLQDFLLKEPPPRLDKRAVLWILKQLQGLLEALCYIHGLPSTLSLRTAYHCDIKPENILLFQTSAKEYTFKFGDFGSAEMHDLISRSQSGHAKSPRGTVRYEAPDLKTVKKLSRPNDVWSTACVFLEILIWLCVPLEQRSKVLSRLSETRLAKVSPSSKVSEKAMIAPQSKVSPTLSEAKSSQQTKNDQFWTGKDEDGPVELKEGVVDTLNELQGKYCKGRKAFLQIVLLIRESLEINPSKRPTALEMDLRLRSEIIQAEKDLGIDELSYLQ